MQSALIPVFAGRKLKVDHYANRITFFGRRLVFDVKNAAILNAEHPTPCSGSRGRMRALVHARVLPGRYAHGSLEKAGEVALICETDFNRDMGDAHAFAKQFTGIAQSELDQVFVRRHSHNAHKHPLEVKGAQAGYVRQLFQGQVFRKMFFDEFPCTLDWHLVGIEAVHRGRFCRVRENESGKE